MHTELTQHLDVLIVGAGLSGICAAYYLQTRCPTKRYTILEARDSIGGTWDLFRYPGIRSDSDMHTLGYSFRPWRGTTAMADGPAILNYVRDTAHEFTIDRHIRFDHRVLRAAWSSTERRWTVEAAVGPAGAIARFTCGFLFMCSGYYDYDRGYTPAWPDVERFAGQIIHPQQWPANLEYAGKRVIVIGSGATAVTLVPALARQAAHVTMLQRSPSYVVALPAEDPTVARLYRRLPAGIAYHLARWWLIGTGMYFFMLARRLPIATRQTIMRQARAHLGPGFDVDTHFSPRYNPWDERLCVAPNGDLFQAIASGKAAVVTDAIERFTPTGIRLRSGSELGADIIVTATGLALKLMGGAQLTVDGVAVDLGRTLSYKGIMYSDVPNLASAFGYTNASWTLKCELIAQFVCRLVNEMDRRRHTQCTPRPPAGMEAIEPAINLTSGYVQRAIATFPRQAGRQPWRVYQNYLRDMFSLRFGRLHDGTLEFR